MSVRAGGSQSDASTNNFGPQIGFAWSPGKFNNRPALLRGGFGIAYNGIAQSNSLDVRFNAPFVQNSSTLSGSQILTSTASLRTLTIRNGYAANPNGIVTFGPNNLPTTGRTDLTALPSSWPTTTTTTTPGSEYDLGHDWAASIGYQGSFTNHLTQRYNLYNVGSANGVPLVPNVSGITYYTDDGGAKFNALLLELRRNFSRSFSIHAQYRFSHSMDTGSNAYTDADSSGLFQVGHVHELRQFGLRCPPRFQAVWRLVSHNL